MYSTCNARRNVQIGLVMKVRVKFRKFGALRFIGHLDVMRFFQKTIRRAQIDIAYSQGYNPHQIMSFASPLGVGLESNGEYMDIEVNSVTNSQDMINRLNASGVTGIEVVSVKELPENAGNAMASVAAARYLVEFREGREPAFDYKNKLDEFYSQESILITKQTKKSTKEMNLRPGIYELSCKDGIIHMLVDASSSGNIKPAMVIEAYLSQNGETLQENALLITREDTFTNNGTDEAPQWMSLDDVGTDINQAIHSKMKDVSYDKG